jgi:hypothetical protein
MADSKVPTCVDVSIVLPCLNEAESLPICLPVAMAALEMARQQGYSGEVVVADNGSTDGSQEIARRYGARVVDVSQKGYGAALLGGFHAARGRFLVMGDADGSYDFRQSIPMIKQLAGGVDICMGSRFRGEIKPGAMPWKNRYIGNPILTGILNLFFRSNISDAHCGLRALTKKCFEELKLTSTGMEFASEMIVKASLAGKKITEVPVTLSPDCRSRPPHLRPWRDGWRHLIFLFLLSPLWLFLAPGLCCAVAGMFILLMSVSAAMIPGFSIQFFGNTWAIFAGGLIALGQQGCIFAIASYLYGITQGFRQPVGLRWLKKLNLEVLLMTGVMMIALGAGVLAVVLLHWTSIHFHKIQTVVPQVIGITLILGGVQNIFGGFLLSIIGGNTTRFMEVHQQ